MVQDKLFESVVRKCRREGFPGKMLIRQLKQISDDVGQQDDVKIVFKEAYSKSDNTDDEELAHIVCDEWLASKNNETICWVLIAAGKKKSPCSALATTIFDEIFKILRNVGEHQLDSSKYESLKRFKQILNKYRNEYERKYESCVAKICDEDLEVLRAIPVVEDDDFEEILWLLEHGAYKDYNARAMKDKLPLHNSGQFEEEAYRHQLRDWLKKSLQNIDTSSVFLELLDALKNSGHRNIEKDIELRLLHLCYTRAVRKLRYGDKLDGLFSNVFDKLIERNEKATRRQELFDKRNKIVQLENNSGLARVFVLFATNDKNLPMSRKASQLCNWLLFQKYTVKRCCDTDFNIVFKEAFSQPKVFVICLGDEEDTGTLKQTMDNSVSSDNCILVKLGKRAISNDMAKCFGLKSDDCLVLGEETSLADTEKELLKRIGSRC